MERERTYLGTRDRQGMMEKGENLLRNQGQTGNDRESREGKMRGVGVTDTAARLSDTWPVPGPLLSLCLGKYWRGSVEEWQTLVQD